MKKLFSLRLVGRALVLGLLVSGTSCMTTYDHAGRPVQSVDPGLAIAGVAAAGLIGYALADDDRHSHHHHYQPRYYGGYHCR